MIPVTEPFLPNKDEYIKLLNSIWDRNWLTNNGPLVLGLEKQLKSYLGLDNLLFLGNGTIALQIAIKALDLKGEIITTPFSYVATTSSIVWENCTPVFIDINPETFNIDEKLIESAISNKTSAILATHVFGNPCYVDEIEIIAKKYNLKVIYDAAHCFGVEYKGNSIFKYGDISTTSFHATKLFHTIEGGAVICKSNELAEKMNFMRNFGHNGPSKFETIGINGKNSEFHAAMGLCNLKYIDEILRKRKLQYERYISNLSSSKVQFQQILTDSNYNYSYFPVLFDKESTLDIVVEKLRIAEVYPRRYFYPSLSLLPYIVNTRKLINAESISKRVLCLPMYHALEFTEIDRITEIIISSTKK